MNGDPIPVKVDQLFLSNVGFVVLLKGLEDARSLPIFIGAAEAQSIAIQINGVAMPRPLTHDLLKNLLDFLECRLMRIEVCDLKDGTFYARLVLERDGSSMDLDCRPSDAIALALRCDAPIFVRAGVMDEAGRVFDQTPGKGQPAGEGQPSGEGRLPGEPKARKPPAAMTPLETLTQELEQAIEQERYEDAARIRDRIKELKSQHSGN